MCPIKRVAAIYVTLTRGGYIVKRLEFDREPLRLNPEEHGRFTEVRIELFSIEAMENCGLPVNPDKVRHFSKFNSITTWQNEKSEYNEICNLTLLPELCRDCDLDYDSSEEEEDIRISRDQNYGDDSDVIHLVDSCTKLSDVKCVIIGLRRKLKRHCYSSESEDDSEGGESEGEDYEPPEKKAKE